MSSYTPAQRRVRLELVALYRLFVQFGWTDLTYTHISARAPDDASSYLINPYGLLFDEVDLDNLAQVPLQGEPDASINRAGHAIHTAVLEARPDVNFVLHSHTPAGVAVSAMRCGLLPISQHANAIMGTLASHRSPSAEHDDAFAAALTRDLGDNFVMLLQCHGLLACGRSAAEGFLYMYFLERACEVQVKLAGSGADWHAASDEVRASLGEWGMPRQTPWGRKPWAALMRMLARNDPIFKELC